MVAVDKGQMSEGKVLWLVSTCYLNEIPVTSNHLKHGIIIVYM